MIKTLFEAVGPGVVGVGFGVGLGVGVGFGVGFVKKSLFSVRSIAALLICLSVSLPPCILKKKTN